MSEPAAEPAVALTAAAPATDPAHRTGGRVSEGGSARAVPLAGLARGASTRTGAPPTRPEGPRMGIVRRSAPVVRRAPARLQVPPGSQRTVIAVYAPGAEEARTVQGSGFLDYKLRGKLQPGSAVEVDERRTADRDGVEYVWVQQGAVEGYVKRGAVILDAPANAPAVAAPQQAIQNHVARPQANGPKAGFEHEFKRCFVFDGREDAPLKRRAAHGMQADNFVAKKKKDDDAPRFAKGTKIFSARNNTWTAEADTSFPGLSNLEIVSAPLTPAEMDSDEAAEDRDALEVVRQRLLDANGTNLSVIEPAGLFAGVVVHIDAFLLASGNEGFMQLTEAVKVPNAAAPDATWLEGLRPGAWDVLLRTASGIEDMAFNGKNPKERLPRLLKTPLSDIFGTVDPKEPPERVEAWMTWVMEKVSEKSGNPDVHLDAQVGVRMVATYNNANKHEPMTAPDFTWRQFLKALLHGTDRLAEWSRSKPFNGEETFGYGVVDDPSIRGEWYVEEARQEGIQTSGQLATEQNSWKQHVASGGAQPRTRRADRADG